jgi:glyoxylase-like metal-dependent hydrolase (beta-lactamase superfamily II)
LGTGFPHIDGTPEGSKAERTSDSKRTSDLSGNAGSIDSTESIDRADVHRIEFTVDWPPGQVAAYLVGGPEPLLIDAGMAGDRGRRELDAGIEAAGYDVADVSHLLVTHPHVDHIGQVGAVVDAADPTVYVPASVRERLARDPEDLASAVAANATAAGLVSEARDLAVEMAVDSLERNRDLLPPARVNRWIGAEAGPTPTASSEAPLDETPPDETALSESSSDGADSNGASGNGTEDDTFDFAVGDHTFTAISTPGHQADHHCYETTIDGEGVLFAGDMALAPFRPVLLQVGLDGVEAALGAFETSLDRLGARSVERVFPGHGPIHADYTDALDRDRRSCRRLVGALAKRLDADGSGSSGGSGTSDGDEARGDEGTAGTDAGRTAAGLARERTDGEWEFAYLLPEVVTGLARLDATGRVRVSTDDAGVRRYRPA